ncbi:P-loop containing nucleoside triphosphate hydrolase protein [Leucosporidium creatinivorum]|uniref:p-loop containing nucleoside triphosphate hydrolase protein n=1 Tax=Leucosporidium creatinivorum TaxID=106004 RepID=A0A1Y2FBH3_9BASI|nr:P-loop containing nucleoside triphosphate hydrolase protein [Leucosporidium creatinivorum]
MSSDPNLQLLNRQLSGMGMYRRSNNISLNAPSPLSTPPLQTENAASPVASTSTLPNADAASTGAEEPATASAPPSSTKRKLRTSRDPSTPKRVKPSASAGIAAAHAPPLTRLADLGGVDACVEKMLELVALPLCHPEVYLHTGVRPPRGVLLVGPPGCGKTMLAGAIAGELGVPFISISAPSVVSGMSGESEKTLRETFEEAAKLAPCILFIDEIDAITPKRETAQREMERRIVAQLLTCMDDLAWDKTDNKPVMILGATNRPDSLDPALRRAGRFDAEITMGVPDQAGRERILRVLMAKLRLSGDFDYTFLAKSTPGYVGADLSALTGAAGVIAVKRIFEQMGVEAPVASAGTAGALSLLEGEQMMVDDDSTAPPTPAAEESSTAPTTPAPVASDAAKDLAVSTAPFSTLPPSLALLPIASFLQNHPSALTTDQLAHLSLTNADFTAALSIVQPSSQREGFTTVPDVTWADLGALQTIREEMRMSIVRPIRRPEVFAMLGLQAPCGVLLWGPPGCGKTLLAKAVANESRANFISVKGPELLNKYVGESERAVRQVFARARASSPCIIFFDELDAMVPRRDDSLSESSARLVNTLLTELDGLEPRKQVFVIGATNRPDILDPAMVRPGRLDKLLYVDLPSPDERVEILRAQTRKTPLGEDVDLETIARAEGCNGFSGADLSALVREAAVMALREVFSAVDMDDDEESTMDGGAPKQPLAPVKVEQRHFLTAVARTPPSVSSSQRRRFATLRAKFAGQPVGHAKEEGGENGEGVKKESGEPAAAAALT